MGDLQLKRVLFVYHQFSYGGASKSLAFWANSLAKSGANVHICTYKSACASHYPLLQSITFSGRTANTRIPFFDRLFDLKFICREVKRFNPDVVIGLMPVNGFYSFFAAKCSNAKVIVSERGYPAADNGMFGKLKRFFMNYADGGVFQTKGAMAFYKPRLINKSIILPNPAAPGPNSIPFSQKKNEIVFMGRFELRQKRQDVALDVVDEIRKSHPDVMLNFFGDGPDFERVKRDADMRGLQSNVRFWGAVESPQDVLEGYRYFILTSDYEGIPNSLIEAMLAGMVCVTTDCDPGGARLLIDDQENGFIVDQGDALAIAKRLISLLNGEGNAASISSNSRLVSDLLNESKISQALATYVGDILS